jgi:uroporphyrinogen-III synthase
MPRSRNHYRAHLATDAPLLGATIVVTRPSATAAPLKRLIVKNGGVVLSLPSISLRSVSDAAVALKALKGARDADVVIFTSPSAVSHAFRLAPKLKFARATKIFTIGSASAAALARRGVRDAAYPSERLDSEGLLELPGLAKIRRRRVVLVGAPGGRDVLAPALRSRGARVSEVFVYRRVAPALDRRHLAALEAAQAPLVTLLSSLEALHHLRDRLPLRLFARLADGDLIASSQRVADAARGSLFANVHVAASAETAAMIDAARTALGRHRI